MAETLSLKKLGQVTNSIKPNDFKPNGIKPSDHLPFTCSTLLSKTGI